MDTLQAWDIAYYSEKLREAKYAISQEELKPYFPEPRVVQGLFSIVERLYEMVDHPPGLDHQGPGVQHREAAGAQQHDEVEVLPVDGVELGLQRILDPAL